MGLENISTEFGISAWLLALLITWILIWKGFALWRASRKNQPVWFVIILVINTFGILEILYLFLFSKISFDKENKAFRKKSRKK